MMLRLVILVAIMAAVMGFAPSQRLVGRMGKYKSSAFDERWC